MMLTEFRSKINQKNRKINSKSDFHKFSSKIEFLLFLERTCALLNGSDCSRWEIETIFSNEPVEVQSICQLKDTKSLDYSKTSA